VRLPHCHAGEAARLPGTPLGYESFEHRSEVVHLAPSRAIYLGFGLFPTGSGPALFVLVSDGLVSKP
jgi:hypothetical protein